MAHTSFRRGALWIALAFVSVPPQIIAQVTTGSVRGRVVDAAGGRGIADAQVSIEGTRLGAISGANADLTTATPVAENLATNAAFAGVLVAPGTYSVRTVPAGTPAAGRPAAVNSSLSVTVAAGNGRTIVIADAAAGGTPLRSFALTDQ